MGVGFWPPARAPPEADAATPNGKADAAANAANCIALFIPQTSRARESGHQAALAQGARQLVVGRRREYLPGHVHGRLALLAAVVLAHPLPPLLSLFDVHVLVRDAEPLQQLPRVPRVLAPVRAVDLDSEHSRPPSSPRLGHIITRARESGNRDAEVRPSIL